MKFTSFAATLIAVVMGTQAFANITDAAFIDVPSLTFDGFTQLNRAGMGGGDQTAANATFAAGYGSNVVGSGDAVLQKVSGSVNPAGAGLYGGGTYRIYDTTLPGNVTGVVLQAIINDFSSPTFTANFGPANVALSYNGGTQNLTPVLEQFTDAANDYYRFSWDLSALGPITSYNIDVSSSFFQTLALQTNVVPEPATFGLAACGICGMLLSRRRS